MFKTLVTLYKAACEMALTMSDGQQSIILTTKHLDKSQINIYK